jgi:hypothetical protein
MFKGQESKGKKPLIDFNDYRQTIFVSGVGRSGTTWLANIINYANNYRFMFEPFHSQRVDIVSHFRHRQYLRPDNHDKAFIEPAKAILSGKVKNPWVDKLNRKLIAGKRLIKDIRTNHLLKWIKTNFPEIPIILLLRHPCAVAHSKLALNWDIHLDKYLAQEQLMEDFLAPFRAEIQNAQDAFERHIFVWCVENYVPLRQFRSGEIYLAFYEDIYTKPEREIDNLFRFLGKPYEQKVFDAVGMPSALCRTESPILSGESPVENFKDHITDKQIKKAVEILGLFGLNSIYSEDSMPLVSGGEQNPFAV